MLTAALFITAPTWKQPKCPSTLGRYVALSSSNGNDIETEREETPTAWGSMDSTETCWVKKTQILEDSQLHNFMYVKFKTGETKSSKSGEWFSLGWGSDGVVSGGGLVMFPFWCGLRGRVHSVKIYWAVCFMICVLSCIMLYFNKKLSKIAGLNAGSLYAKWWISALLSSLWLHPLE